MNYEVIIICVVMGVGDMVGKYLVILVMLKEIVVVVIEVVKVGVMVVYCYVCDL